MGRSRTCAQGSDQSQPTRCPEKKRHLVTFLSGTGAVSTVLTGGRASMSLKLRYLSLLRKTAEVRLTHAGAAASGPVTSACQPATEFHGRDVSDKSKRPVYADSKLRRLVDRVLSRCRNILLDSCFPVKHISPLSPHVRVPSLLLRAASVSLRTSGPSTTPGTRVLVREPLPHPHSRAATVVPTQRWPAVRSLSH